MVTKYCTLLLILFLSAQVLATNYYVSNFGTSHASGVREDPLSSFALAYSYANNGDTIVFLPGMYTTTQNYGLTITKQLTITSTDGLNTTVIACDNYNGNGMTITGTTVTVIGLTITSCRYGISATTSSLTVSDCSFSATYEGIYHGSGNFGNFTNSQFQSRSKSGLTVIASRSYVSNVSITSGHAGIFAGGTVEMNDIIVRNTFNYAFYLNRASTTLNNVYVDNCHSVGAHFEGGTGIINDSIFSNMYGTTGGSGLELVNDAQVSVSNSVFTKCASDTAVILVNKGTLNMQNCEVTHSQGTGYNTNDKLQGGAFGLTGTSQVHLTKTQIVGNSAYKGGAVYCADATPVLTITDSLLSNNTAMYGGAFDCYPGQSCSITVSNSKIEDNVTVSGSPSVCTIKTI